MASETDWEAIEREYRAGQLSVSEIGRQHGVSHTAINKKAGKRGWTRNLAAKVRQEVSARLVSDGVATCNVREAVETAAARGVELVRQHRAALSRGRSVCARLLDELDSASANIDEIEATIEDETRSDENGKRRANMLKAVSIGSRSGAISALSTALKNLVGLERQAFNLNSGDGGDQDDTDFRVTFVRP